MPRSTRDEIHQDLQRARGNIDAAGEKLMKWVEPMKEFHPEHAQALLVALTALKQTKDFIELLESNI